MKVRGTNGRNGATHSSPGKRLGAGPASRPWGNTASSLFRCFVASSLVGLIAPAAVSADFIQPAPDRSTKDTLGTFVPDSTAAVERFALAEKLEKAAEWSKASEIYQELLENYRDRVLPADVAQSDASSYISVPERVFQKLSQWPADAIAVYNGRYQPAAEQLLQQAGDAASLQRVADRYLLTRAGNTAARRLMQIWWDRGEPAATARMAQRLASFTFADTKGKAMLLYEAGIAWQLAHHTDRAKLVLEQLKKELPDSQGEVAGQQVDLAAALEKVLADATSEQAQESTSWMAFGGSPDRALVPTGVGKSDALLFSIDLTPARANAPGNPNLPPMFPGQLRPQDYGLGVFPVYDKGQLFFQDGYNLFAVGIDGGMKLPGWQAPTVELSSGSFAGPSLRTLAITDDAVYVMSTDLSTPIWTGVDPTGGGNPGIVCRDRDTGKKRWTFNPSVANMPAAAKATQLASPPMVVGDQLFIAARGGRNAQFSDVYVICLDRRTGRFQWASYVASGPNIGVNPYEGFASQVDTQTPQLSYHAGRVFVVTNIGAVAALDAVDGTPAWIRIYSRNRQDINPNMMWRPMPADASMQSRPFSSSPAIISAGRLFALPTDGRSLLILDEADGSPIKEIPRASIAAPILDTLVGLIGDQVILAGERVASVVDWTKAKENAENQKPALCWTMNFPGATLRGRPFLTSEALFLPTDDRLLRVNTKHWKIDQTTPRYPSTWDPAKEGPGNILVTDEHVIVAAAKRINIYTDLASATARLDREIAASPTSPEPLVRYCELLFAAGQHSPAMQKLTAAAALLKTRSEPAAEVRDRILSCALSCANRLARSDQASMQSIAGGYLDVAKSVATAPDQAVQYHLAAAAIELRANAAPGSLSHLQAILDDPAYRVVFCRDSDGQTRYSADIARRQIKELIDRFGDNVYRQTDQLARQKLAAAQSAHDVKGLVETAQQYPNSSAAPSALFAAARLREDAGQFAEAASTLRQLVQDYNRHEDAPSFVEAMARVYAAMPGKARVAAGRLASAAVLMSDPMMHSAIRLPDGQLVQPMRFSEAAKTLRDLAGTQQVRPLPDFHLPSQAQWKTPYADAQAVADVQADHLLPAMPNASAEYRRAVLATAAGDIVILDTAGKCTLRIAAATQQPARDCAWISPTLLLIRSGGELAVIDISQNRLAWKLDIQNLPAIPQAPDDLQPEADAATGAAANPQGGAVIVVNGRARRIIMGPGGMPGMMPGVIVGGAAPVAQQEEAGDIRDVDVAANRVMVGTASGRVAALDASSGKLLWQLRPDSGSVTRIASSDDFTAVKFTSAQKSILAAIDNDTGRLIFRKAFQPGMLQNLAVSDDGKLVYTLIAKLVCKDLFDQSDNAVFETPMPNGVAFAGQDRPDQLLLTDSMIIATSDNGSQIRLFSFFTGRQMLPGGRSAGEVPIAQFPPGNVISTAHLVLAEPYVYTFNRTAVRAVNLQQVDNTDRRVDNAINIKDVIPGTRHVLAFDPPLRAGDAKSVPSLRIVSFSRAATKNGESGKVEHDATIEQPAGITSWQVVEGGLYLTTLDKRLLFMPVSK